VAKAESGRLEPRVELIDLGETVQYLRGSLAPLVRDPAVELVVTTPPDLPLLATDPAMLTVIVRNLATNAIKFTERGEVRVEVAVDQATEQVDVVVRDTGIGIPAEHLERVFEEFHQVPGPLQVTAHGTGLGLPYARRLAGILGGSLTMDSAVGVGTTVTLRLPLTGPPADGDTRFATALVVDDDPAFRALVRRTLAPTVEDIVDAADGAAALERLTAHPPDLLVLDLHIPPPDGYAVLAAVRADPRTAAVPVVVVTAAELDRAETAELSASAVVLQKSNLTPNLLVAAAAAATRLIGRRRD
jgi:CheY-like chemotaxis protein/two-component sensor histidine kinase